MLERAAVSPRIVAASLDALRAATINNEENKAVCGKLWLVPQLIKLIGSEATSLLLQLQFLSSCALFHCSGEHRRMCVYCSPTLASHCLHTTCCFEDRCGETKLFSVSPSVAAL